MVGWHKRPAPLGERWRRIDRALRCVALLLGCAPTVHAQQYAYVTNLGANTVSVIDTETNGVVATIPVGDNPDGIAATPDGRIVFVTNFLSDDVSVIDTSAAAVVATVPVGSGPVGVGITPNGARAYVANRGSNTVSVIDRATNTVTATIGVGLGPNAVAITPDGKFAYVTNSFSTAPGTVTVIDIGSNTLTATIEVGRSPTRLAISPDGAFVYVTNFRSWNVSVIDTAAQAVAATIPVFGRPTGIAINPNGAALYVVTLGGRVETMGTDTNALDAEVAVGDSPYGIATTRNGERAYVANFGAGTASVIDLVAASLTTDVTVGARPFAVAVNCTGSSCTEPPFTPRPTRTPTITPTVTASRPPTATRAATATPPPTPPPGTPVRIIVGSASGPSGSQISFAVTLRTAGYQVAGTQNDIGFDTHAPIASRGNGKPDCAVNPEIDKNAASFAFQPAGCSAGVSCTKIRALVLSLDNTAPIPDGAILYTCRVAIAANAPLATYPLLITPFSTVASDPTGASLPAAGDDGAITVVATAGQSAILPSSQSNGPAASAGAGCAMGGSGGQGMIGHLALAAVALAWRRRRAQLR